MVAVCGGNAGAGAGNTYCGNSGVGDEDDDESADTAGAVVVVVI